MKGIFSVASLFVLTCTMVSAAPLARRDPIPVSPTFFQIISADKPDIQFGTTLIPQISVTDGSHEVDSFVSFTIPPIAGASSTSTCRFVLKGVTASPGAVIQLFSLGSQLIGSETFNRHPYYNQDEGQYSIDSTSGNSTPLYGGTVPCNIGGAPTQFVIRPHFTDSSVTWTQSSTVGAFLEVTV